MKKDKLPGKVKTSKKNNALITSIIDIIKDSSLKAEWRVSIDEFLDDQDVRINSIVIGKVGALPDRIYTGSNSNKIVVFNLDGQNVDEIEIDYETEIIDLYITNVTEESIGNNLVVRTSNDSILFYTATEAGNYKDLKIDIEEDDITAFYPLCQNDEYDRKLLLLGYSTGEVKLTTYDSLRDRKNKIDLIKSEDIIKRQEISGICGSFNLLNDKPGIIVGYKNGTILLYDEEYNLIDKHDVDKSIEKLFFLEEVNALVIITDEYEILYFTFPQNIFNFCWYYKTDSLATSVIPNDGDGFFVLLEDDGLIYKFNNNGNLQFYVDPSLDGTAGQIWDNCIYIASNEGELAKYELPEKEQIISTIDNLHSIFNLQALHSIKHNDFAVWFNSEFAQPDREPYFIEFLNYNFINSDFDKVFRDPIIDLFSNIKYDTDIDTGLIEKIRSSFVLKENFKVHFSGTNVADAINGWGKIVDLNIERQADTILQKDPLANLDYISLLEKLSVNRIDILWKLQLAEDDEIVEVTLFHDPFIEDKDQILVATRKGQVSLIDFESSDLIWSFSTSNEDGNINNIVVSDICNDGKKEIIIGLENCRNSVIIITDNNNKYEGTKVSFNLKEVNLVWGPSFNDNTDYHLYQAYCYSPGLANKTVHKVGCFDFDGDGVDDLIISSEDGNFNVFYFDRDLRQNIKTSKIQILENEEDDNEDILDFCFTRNEDESVSVYTGSQTGIIEKLNLVGNKFEKESSLFSNERYGIEGRITDLLVTEFKGERLILYSSEDNFVYCLNEFLDYKWSYKADGNITSIDVSHTDSHKYIYCVSDDSMGKLIALDFNGNKAWDYPFFKPLQKIHNYLNALIIADSDGFVYLTKIIEVDSLREKIEAISCDVIVDRVSSRYQTDKFIRLYSTRKLLEQNNYSVDDLHYIKKEVDYHHEFESTVRREVITLISDSLLADNTNIGLQELLIKPILENDKSPEVRMESAKAFIKHFELYLSNNFNVGQILSLLAKDEDEYIIAFLAGELGKINLDTQELRNIVSTTIIDIISNNKDEDWILNEAASSIGIFLCHLSDADLLQGFILLLCETGFEVETLERIRNKIPSIKITFLFNVYLQILKQDISSLKDAFDKFSLECNVEDIRSFSQIIGKVKSFVSITNQKSLDEIISDQLLQKFSNSLNINSPSFASVISKLDEYTRENNISEKIVSLSFASESIGNFSDEKSLPNIIDTALFEIAIHNHLNTLISNASRFLREKVDFEIELESKDIIINDNGIADINFLITNKGYNKVEEIEIKVKIDKQSKFDIIENIGEIGELEKSADKKVFFKIKPKIIDILELNFDIAFKGCEMPITKVRRILIKEAIHREWQFIPNPYKAGLPLDNDDIFVGRESLIQEILIEIKNDPVFVMGHRRMGKTSLVKFIQRHYLTTEEYLPIFFSAEKMVFSSMNDFLFSFCRPIANELSRKNIISKEKKEEYLNAIRANGLIDFGVFFDDVLYEISDRGKILILIIDEYPKIHEQVELKIIDAQFVSNLRGYMQNNSNEFRMIYTGASSLKYLKSQYSSNIMGVGKSIEVSFLSEGDIKELISKPLNNQMQIEDSAFQYLMELSNGQPFLVQVILKYLVDKLNREKKGSIVFKEAIEDGINYFLGQSLHLKYDWGSFVEEHDDDNPDFIFRSSNLTWDKNEEKIAKAYKQLIITSITDNWKRTKNGLSKNDIFFKLEDGLKEFHKINVSIFDETLNLMSSTSDILRIANNLYFIKVGLFREWVINKMNFSFDKTLLEIEHIMNQ